MTTTDLSALVTQLVHEEEAKQPAEVWVAIRAAVPNDDVNPDSNEARIAFMGTFATEEGARGRCERNGRTLDWKSRRKANDQWEAIVRSGSYTYKYVIARQDVRT